MWLSYWWCDHCGVEVPKEHVTVAFTHALAGGGCGKPLMERFNSTEPPEDDSLARLTAERDAALAEVQRLREAVRNLLIKLDAALPKLDGLCALASVHGAPYTGPTLHEEIAAARSLVEPAP